MSKRPWGGDHSLQLVLSFGEKFFEMNKLRGFEFQRAFFFLFSNLRLGLEGDGGGGLWSGCNMTKKKLMKKKKPKSNVNRPAYLDIFHKRDISIFKVKIFALGGSVL